MIEITAPAKLNLSLHITGKRADGFHLLESVVAFAHFGDVLKIAPADDITLEIEGEFASALLKDVQNNLVIKAARKLQQQFGVQAGAHITLQKKLPVGSGMGGGSSDAAAALRGLAQLWNINVNASEIFDIAKELGSDVPMCYAGTPAFVRGVGEELSPISLRAPVYAVLVHPRAPLLTADVFARFSGQFDAPIEAPATFDSFAALMDF
ncbi:MAG: 4-(cytidine 5'-diphospho)-2-C-methyl-D-erythritol kinase, partial [Alphaproteobacteria bacterium]|nr:4-(cytidine 5'-diphospho)-2-C-methyl-D-erythritol kinase [Alphaproteobacteria bacterium]